MTGATGSPTLRARAFVAMQYLLPQHLLCRAVRRLTRVRLRPVKNALIGAFVRHFQPDMSQAADPDPLSYPTFNAFFTRALKCGARPCEPDARLFASPVDATVSQIGRLDGSKILQAKGHEYTVEALLGGPSMGSQRFAGGSFATLYLAPCDYHRVHMPASACLREAWFIPGTLFSVNAATAAAVPGLFARNERLVLLFESGPLTFAVVLIGALFVGSMSTVWHGELAPRSPRVPTRLAPPAAAAMRLEKGAELGRFNMGSTVIVLLPHGTIGWRPELAPGGCVQVGQTLGWLEGQAGPSGAR
jgi:phosphatidylserine decarboxylase